VAAAAAAEEAEAAAAAAAAAAAGGQNGHEDELDDPEIDDSADLVDLLEDDDDHGVFSATCNPGPTAEEVAICLHEGGDDCGTAEDEDAQTCPEDAVNFEDIREDLENEERNAEEIRMDEERQACEADAQADARGGDNGAGVAPDACARAPHRHLLHHAGMEGQRARPPPPLKTAGGVVVCE